MTGALRAIPTVVMNNELSSEAPAGLRKDTVPTASDCGSSTEEIIHSRSVQMGSERLRILCGRARRLI